MHIRFLFFILLLSGCTSHTVFKKPKDLIPKEQMADLIADLYLAKALDMHPKRGQSDFLEISGVDYKVFVFHKYQIDTLRFKRSNFYYNTQIDAYEAIYKMVEAKLKKQYKTFKTIDSLRLDSIR